MRIHGKLPLIGATVAAMALLTSSSALFAFSPNGEITPLPAYHKRVTITFWSWVPGTQAVVNAFEKAYPSIKVNYQNVGAGSTELDKLTTAIKAGTGAPDVVQIPDYWLPSIVSTGGLRNLDQYGAKTLLPDFYPWIRRQIDFNGAVYGIPQDQDPIAMMYNQTIFKKYGLSVPSTWAQYEKDAEILHDKSSKVVMTEDFSASNSALITAMAWSNGGHIAQKAHGSWTYELTNPAWKRVLNYWQTLDNKHLIPNDVTYESIQYIHSIAEGNVATLMGPDWEIPLLEEWAPKQAGQWRVAMLPGWTASQKASGVWGGGAEAVTTQAKNPRAAYLFAAWINTDTKAISLNWTNGGEMPTAMAGSKLPALTAPNAYFGNERIGKVFLAEDKYVPTDWQWPDNVAYFYSKWPSLMSQALNSRKPMVSTLGAIESAMIQEARISGIPVSAH